MAITTQMRTDVANLYVALFGRAPERDGLGYWVNQLDAGKSVAQVAQDMFNTEPARATYPTFLTNEEIIGRFYTNVLGRTADADGLAYWAAKLNAGQSKGSVINEMITAVTSFTGTGTDELSVAARDSKALFTNKVTVGLYYAVDLGGNDATQAATVLNGVTKDASSVEAAKAAAATSAGSTFTLTTAIDSKTGTAGNDVFIGDAATSSSADQVVGGSGTDTLKLYGAATTAPAYSGIETVELYARNAGDFDVSGKADVKTLVSDGAVTAKSKFTVTSGQSVALKNSNISADLVTSATATSMALTVDKLGAAGSAATVDFAGAALATLDLTVAGNSVVNLTNDEKLATLNISGAGNVTIDADAAGNAAGTLLTTVAAASATGNISIQLEDDTTAKDVTVATGSGNDTVNFGAALTKADKFDGGAGTDTLEITQASVTTVEALSATDKATLNANLAGIEVLKVTDALTSNLDASRFDSINSFVFAAGINPAATSTLSKVASGVTVEIQDAAGDATDVLAVEITDATLAGNNSDTLNVVLNDAAAGGASAVGVINAVGVDILNINTKSLTAAGAAGTTTSYTLDIANTSTALDKVVVTGNVALDLTAVALVNSVAEIDASGMTLAAATSNGLKVAVATGGTNGVKITGSGGIDALTGGDAADVIDGGAGADVITGGAGNDVLTGGAGVDTFTFGASFAANGKDVIKDFAFGATGDVLNVDALTDGTGKSLTLTTGSANQSLSAEGVFVITLGSAINGKDYGDADFTTLFGTGTGQFNTTVDAATDTAVIAVVGTDETHIYSVAASATTLTGAMVDLVGVIQGTGTFAAAQFTLS
ncbi:MAG TPA: DUF4214 domain-containing protein [Noviherbaspirillum sp.]|nr:DUF4214 domain-containing protein [Noviherbaspirillum sp.]